jgi:hypothetical protein
MNKKDPYIGTDRVPGLATPDPLHQAAGRVALHHKVR